MLPPKARLRRREDFSETVRCGARAGSAMLVVHLESSSSHDVSRAGFIVSRTVGDAVTRNLVRRRLRHLVRDRLDRLPAGSRLVVRALAPAGGATSATLAAQLDRALARLTVSAGAR